MREKKNLIMLVISVFFAILFVNCVAFCEEEEGYFSDNINFSSSTDGRSINSYFYYSDEMMLSNANVLSTDLAKVAMGLSDAAYGDDGVMISNCLGNMGYTILDIENYTGREATYQDCDFVAYTIAHKVIDDYNVYIIAVRGTYQNEWISNFHLASPDGKELLDYHWGFYAAANEIFNSITNCVNTSNNIILVTGHSRGAAVANIVAGELSYGQRYASCDHIFGYTFACPAVKVNADHSLTNIRNFNNPGDLITVLPLDDWPDAQYGRYGIDIDLSIDNVNISNIRWQYLKRYECEYGGFLYSDEYRMTLKTIAATRADFLTKEHRCMFDFLGWLLGKKDEQTWNDIVDYYSMLGIVGMVRKALGRILCDNLMAGTEIALDPYKELCVDLLNEVDNAIEVILDGTLVFEDWLTSHSELLERIYNEFSIVVNTKEDLLYARYVINSTIIDLQKSEKQRCISLLTDVDLALQETIKISPEDFDNWLPSHSLLIDRLYNDYDIEVNTRADLVSARNTINSIVNDNTFTSGNLATLLHLFCSAGANISTIRDLFTIDKYTLIIPAIWHAHQPETYVLWINSMYYGYEGWKDYSNEISITIPDNIYNIGERCFYNCKGLKSITIPDRIAQLIIGDNVFGECVNFKTITMPVDLEYEHFGNSEVETIHFTVGQTGIMPDRRDSLGYMDTAEYGAIKTLKKVIFDEGITRIGSGAFAGYYYDYSGKWYANGHLEEVELPSTLESIGDAAFSDQVSEQLSVTLPEGLKSIGNSCFWKSKGLSDIVLPESLEKIGDCAFKDCTNLQGNINLCNPVTEVGDYAFEGCNSLSSITIESSDITLGYKAFDGCSGVKTITIPVDLEYVYFGCTGAEKIHYTVGQTGIMPDRYYDPLEGLMYFENTAESGAIDTLKKVIFDEGITRIGSNAFSALYLGQGNWQAGFLEEVVLPSTLESIGDFAFARQGRNQFVVTLPGGLKSIGSHCFYYVAGLSAIIPTDNLEIIGEFAFCGCTGLQGNIQSFTNLETIGEYAFNGCTGLQGDIKLCNPVTEVGDYAFEGCNNLSSITIESSDITLGYKAFDGCSGVKTITMPVDLEYEYFGSTGAETIHYTVGQTGIMLDRQVNDENLDYYYRKTAEYGSYETLKMVVFDEGITHIGNYAFCGPETVGNLEEIELPSTLESIGDYAFAYQEKNQFSVTLPEMLKFIGNYCFYNSSGMSAVILPGNLDTIGEYAFCGCTGLQGDINLHAQGVEVGEYAFYGCSGLNSISIESSDITFGYKVFDGCSGVKTITMPVDLEYEYFGSTGAETIHYTVGQTGIMPDRQVNDENLDHYYGKSAEYRAINTLKKVAFDEGITHIGNYAFYGWFYDTVIIDNHAYTGPVGGVLEEVELPSTLKSIGNFTFSHCESLKGNIILGPTMTIVGEKAFENCNNISSITIEAKDIILGNNVFEDCNGVKSITMPVDLEYTHFGRTSAEIIHYTVGKTGIMPDRQDENEDADLYWLNNAEHEAEMTLKKVIFDEGITQIGNYAFDGRFEGLLEEVELPSTLERIGDYAFYSQHHLKELHLPSMLKRIGENAFARQDSLTELYLPNSITEIGSFAFSEWTNLSTVYFFGNVPAIGEWMFGYTAATAYYPSNNPTWTTDVLQDYGGTITWLPWDPTDVPLYDHTLTLPANTTTIDSEAFAGLTQGVNIVIPSTVTFIADDAFAGSNVIVIGGGNGGGYVEQYCEEKGIPFVED